MPFLKFIVALALAAPLFTTPALAKGLLYDCKITERRKDVDWITPTYVVVVDAAGAVTVIDDIILYFNEEPLKPRRVRQRGDELRMFYTLRVTDTAQMRWTVAYSAFLNTANNTIKLSARSTQGGSVSWRGAGTCKTRTQ